MLISHRQQNVTLPHVEDISLPPPYVVRLIIVYGRSYCIPVMSTRAKEVCLRELVYLLVFSLMKHHLIAFILLFQLFFSLITGHHALYLEFICFGTVD